ncbi:MAG: SMP-30/gluconolactonase/LRE family protein, partial [Bacteroidota bacterium]
MNNHRLFLALLLTISTLFLFQACQSEAEQPPLYQSEDYVDVGEFTSGLEGPVVDQHGNLYFVNLQHNGSIGKVDSIGRLQMWIQQLPEGSTGNGLRIGDQGQFYVADYTGHNVLRISPDGQMVKVHTHNDSMNQPNDLTIGSDNVLYASDPSWADSSGQLWRIDPDGHSLLLEAKMGTTNGVELSPDERTLY